MAVFWLSSLISFQGLCSERYCSAGFPFNPIITLLSRSRLSLDGPRAQSLVCFPIWVIDPFGDDIHQILAN